MGLFFIENRRLFGALPILPNLETPLAYKCAQFICMCRVILSAVRRFVMIGNVCYTIFQNGTPSIDTSPMVPRHTRITRW